MEREISRRERGVGFHATLVDAGKYRKYLALPSKKKKESKLCIVVLSHYWNEAKGESTCNMHSRMIFRYRYVPHVSR